MRRPGQVYAFRDFRLDVGRRALSGRSDGRAVAVSAHALDTLIHLVQRPGELVTRGELLAAVWPHVTVVDNSANQAVSALRRALGDDPASPRYVETVTGRGYRFLADVVAEDRAARDPRAYQLYASGWSAITRPGGANYLQARADLEAAVAIDPDFAMAYVCLTDCYRMMRVHGLLDVYDTYAGMTWAVDRAMELAPERSEALAVRARLEDIQPGAPPLAGTATLHRALELNPHCFWANRYLGQDLLLRGRFDDALRHFHRAQAAEPLATVVLSHIGMTYYYAGRCQEAVDQLELTLRIDPKFEVARAFLGRALVQLGEFERAISEFESSPCDVVGRVSDIALARLAAGDARPARALLADLLAEAEAGRTRHHDLCVLSAALDDAVSAIHWLDRAEQDYTGVQFFTVDPWLRRLHAFPAVQSRLVGLGVARD